jgi:hypothetical protein
MPVQTEKWVGTNYTPAYACNQVQFWHDFRADDSLVRSAVVGRRAGLCLETQHFPE